MDKELISFLNEWGIKFKIFEHEPVFTVEEARSLKENIPGLHCKCLFLKDQNSNFYLVAMSAIKRLDMKFLKTELNLKKLSFASPDELKEKLNVTPGSVSIFTLIYAKSVSLVLDEELWNAQQVGFHPNINTSTLVLDHENLKIFLDKTKFKPLIFKLG